MTSSRQILFGCSLVAWHSLDAGIVPMGEPKLECFDQDSGETAKEKKNLY